MESADKFWDKKAEGYAKSSILTKPVTRGSSPNAEILHAPNACFGIWLRNRNYGYYHAPHVHHIDAIDISGNMLEIARAKAREAGIANVTFSRGTLAGFGAEPESLDAVLGLNVIHLLPDRSDVLAEVARILKPGGIFVSSTGCLGNSYLRFIKVLVPLAKVLGLMPDIFIIKKEGLVKEIESNGFSIESQWSHGFKNTGVFIIARKNAS